MWNHKDSKIVKAVLKGEEGTVGGRTPSFQSIQQQNYRNQNCVVLTQKQIHGPMEQNRGPRYKPRFMIN